MPELIAPTARLRESWMAAREEWGRGVHQDGSGLLGSDDVDTVDGFAAWVTRLNRESDESLPIAENWVHTTYWWIVEQDEYLGAISLRHRLNDFLLRAGGHIGYGVRPSARRRGLATWALGVVLSQARVRGLGRVLVTCDDENTASARTIVRHGGVLEDVRDTELGHTRRYWIELGSPRAGWTNTTHDWSSDVDLEHLAEIRRHPDRYAPGGLTHLVLEVVAYADDAAATSGRSGECTIARHADGSVSVTDDGPGTDTRFDQDGRPIRKPVAATRDLRFFDGPPGARLPDGEPRRGMSVVSALSEWLVHTNRRRNGSWTQRYEYGTPVTALVPVDADGTRETHAEQGTTIHFLPDPAVVALGRLTPTGVRLAAAGFPHLRIRYDSPS